MRPRGPRALVAGLPTSCSRVPQRSARSASGKPCSSWLSASSEWSSTSRWWKPRPWLTPRAASSSGRYAFTIPMSERSFMPWAALGAASSADSSAPTRSKAGRTPSLAAWARAAWVTALSVRSSSRNSSATAKRTARSGLMGSAASASGEVMRTRLAPRSARPPSGSTSSPASVRAMALMVRSRSTRSPATSAPPWRGGAKSCSTPPGSAARQWRLSASISKAEPPIASANCRAARRGSGTTQS